MLEIKLQTNRHLNSIKSAIDVGDAFNKIYSYPTDLICINISNHLLELPLCHVFSELLEDFLVIIRDVQKNNEGMGLYGFSQNDFFDADWKLIWSRNGMLKIDFDWRYIKKQALSSKMPSTIELQKSDFLNQWKICLQNLMLDLNGVKLEYPEEFIEINNW